MRLLTTALVTQAVLACSCASVDADATTVYLVRHAEKQKDATDPSLSSAGQIRAKQLAQVLRSANLKACVASQFRRTQETAKPAAELAKLKVLQRPAGKERKLADEIRQDFNGQSVLFVGHSNTVPLLLRHLGAENIPAIGESDYDNLFVVQISDSGQTSVLQLHYGSASSNSSNPKSTID